MRLSSAWFCFVYALCIDSTSIGSPSPGAKLVALHHSVEDRSEEGRLDQEGQDPLVARGVVLIQASQKQRHIMISPSPDHSAAPPSPAADSIAAVMPGTAPAWAPEEATIPEQALADDSFLSSPALLAYMVSQASTKLMHGREHTAMGRVTSWFVQYWGCAIMGSIVFICGILVLWFNELRSVKMVTLLSRGVSECESIDADKANEETLGCLVHAVGQTKGATPVEDPQFTGVSVANCLKLQSTIEVYEWVQTVKIGGSGSQPLRQSSQSSNPPALEKKSNIQYTFHKEWSTIHRNSIQFQRSAGKPSPDNPRPPRGLNLGTFTSVCKNVRLGSFVLPDDMVEQFRNFEPAMPYLPPTVQAGGLMFYANKDGYFYARPSMRSMWSTKAAPSIEPVVGDLRVRFLCVPQGTATVVAVHCEKDGVSSFVPYRVIPRGCCSNELQDRQRLIEEGARSLDELSATDQDMAPCIATNSMAVSLVCCPCSSIQRVCTKEVVTQEIYYVSEEHSPLEKPFEWVVPRSFWRAWFFRTIGWLLCYLSTLAVLGSLKEEVASIDQLAVYGSWASPVVAAILATATSSFMIACAYLCYSPSTSFKWACTMGIVIALPFIVGRVHEMQSSLKG